MSVYIADCTIVLRGSTFGDHEDFSSVELNGNPHAYKTTEPNRRGLYLFTVNQEFCFPDVEELFDLFDFFGNTGSENTRLREFLSTLDNGTVLLGKAIVPFMHL